MVVDNFPCPGLSPIYIGDTVVKVDLVSSHRDVALFDAHFVGHVSGGVNMLITQSMKPLRKVEASGATM